MTITARDKDIFKFIEEWDGITINQGAKMFWRGRNHAYDLARKRMQKLYSCGLFKYYTDKVTKQRVYCFDKKITTHRLYLLDVYATFVENGAKVLYFKTEPKWMDDKYRSDGFLKYEYNGKKRICCIEIDVTHLTNMDKYEDIYASEEIQCKYGGFPIIVVVGDTITEYDNPKFDTVFLDYKLSDFTETVLAY